MQKKWKTTAPTGEPKNQITTSKFSHISHNSVELKSQNPIIVYESITPYYNH